MSDLLEDDPDATMDDGHDAASDQSAVDPAVRDSVTGEETVTDPEPAVDPDATVADDSPAADVSGWEASLTDDSDPDSTLQAPVPAEGDVTAAAERAGGILRQRAVARADKPTDTSGADYVIDDLLGEGGMGAVFLARQISMDRPVAIKVLKTGAARRKGTQDAFVSEAIITGGLDHPNIVPIYEVGTQESDATPFYSMKQVQGVEWADRFASNSQAENIDILLRVADAIAFAHSRHIIHRDLKPANVMLGQFGEVLVMDWGLAMPTAEHPQRHQFPAPKWGGTPRYMAPEMVDRLMTYVDHRSDIYLLGTLLFEIVTGKPPHEIDTTKLSGREAAQACLQAAGRNRICLR